MDDVTLTSEMLQTCCTAYNECYELAREAYVGFVQFAPTVQLAMLDVEKWHQQYELRRQQTLEDFDEIDRLRTWY